MSLTPFSLDELVDRFPRVRVAVVGDFFLDQYFVIDPGLAEPSVETGLTANQVVAIRHSPGAAGTVVNNLAALDAGEIHAVGLVGDDGHGYLLRRELERRRVLTEALVPSDRRFTPTYTKPMFLRPGAAGAVEVEGERIDIVNRTPTPPDLEDAVVRAVEAVAPRVDAVVVLDQVTRENVGVVTARVRRAICDVAKRLPGTLFYADSRGAIGEFVGLTTKPNEREALTAAGVGDPAAPSDEAAAEAGRRLFARTGREVFLTRGERGVLLTSRRGQCAIPAIPVDGPVDVCGAGDSATAGIVLSLCSGATPEQAALVGNIVASKTVVQIGATGTTTRDAVRATPIDFLFAERG
jgi:rfaE bifunctional protein kinase chain/domain